MIYTCVNGKHFRGGRNIFAPRNNLCSLIAEQSLAEYPGLYGPIYNIRPYKSQPFAVKVT